MPCWSIHLGVCNEVNNIFNYDKELLYFGCLLPDLIDRDTSHYYKDHIISFDDFFNDYKDNISNPLILGYYIHLLTDYYYNNFVYKNSWIKDKDNNIIGIKLVDGNYIYNNDPIFRRNFKQNDFKNFGCYLVNNTLLELPNDYNKIYNNMKNLNIKMNRNSIKDRINYLQSDDFYKYNSFNGYKLFNKDTYEIIYRDCIQFIIDKINNISL